MAMMITADRARKNPVLAKLRNEGLESLIEVASELVESFCTVPVIVPARLEEACVQWCALLSENSTGKSEERVGAYYAKYRYAIPPIIKILMQPYLKGTSIPVIGEDSYDPEKADTEGEGADL